MAKGGKEIRTRIKSVKNTQQITKAMKMVAAARLRKSEGRTEASRPYADTLRKVMGNLSGVAAEADHPFLSHIAPDVPRVMVVIYSSDKGLAGSFNSNIFKRAEQFIKELQADGKEVELVCVGKKGYQAFRKDFGLEEFHASFTHKSTFADLQPLTRQLTDAYLGKRVSEVYLVYARYVNIVKNIPTPVRLLPIESVQAEDEPDDGGFRQDYMLEPSPEELLTQLLPRYFQVTLFQAALENFTSENGARMVAMDNATKAAGEMIDELTLQYNKARQAGITMELLDIIGGAEAIN